MSNIIGEGQVLMVNLQTNNPYLISESYVEMSIRHKMGRKATAKEIAKYLGLNDESTKTTNKTTDNGKSNTNNTSDSNTSEGAIGATRNRTDSSGKAS